MIRKHPRNDLVNPPGQIVNPIGQPWKEMLEEKARMCQEEDNRLSKALSNTPNARQAARDAAAEIKLARLVEALTHLHKTIENGPYLEVNNYWYAQQIKRILVENT